MQRDWRGMLSKNYLQLTNEMVRDQFLMPMGMLYAPVVKHESIVEWQDLPISKKNHLRMGTCLKVKAKHQKEEKEVKWPTLFSFFSWQQSVPVPLSITPSTLLHIGTLAIFQYHLQCVLL